MKNNNQMMAENNWTAFSSFYSWNPERFGKYDMKSLKKNGLTREGKHYHLPSYNEWLSIVSSGVTWSGTKVTITDSDVKFRVTPGRTSETSDTDYSYGVSGTSSWTSDYIRKDNGDGTNTDFGLRFKGTDYCCAYRYDMMTTTSANNYWTGNSNGSISMVVRVIYLGSSGSSYTVSSIQNLDWEHNTDFSIALPFCGYQSFADDAGAVYYGSVTGGWNGRYYSATPDGDYYKYLYIDPSGNMRYSKDYSTAYSVRLFRDAY